MHDEIKHLTVTIEEKIKNQQNIYQYVDELDACLKTYAKSINTDFIEWLETMSQNNSTAMRNLGYVYKHGLGVEQNYQKAIKFYQLSANKGNESAQHNLGSLYDDSYVMEQDLEQAFKFYQLASNKGYAPAQYSLGHMYRYGLGVDINYELACKFFQLAADQEYTGAQIDLAHMYTIGFGVAQDYKQAHKLYQLAADKNIDEAFDGLGYIYEKGLGVDRDINKALYYYTLAAKKSGYMCNIYDMVEYNIYNVAKLLLEISGKLIDAENELAELRISAPIEGGEEYKMALQRFNAHIKLKL